MPDHNEINSKYVKIKANIREEDLECMRLMSSLFYKEIGVAPKEIDVISFFIEKSFEMFKSSEEVKKRIAKLTGNFTSKQ